MSEKEDHKHEWKYSQEKGRDFCIICGKDRPAIEMTETPCLDAYCNGLEVCKTCEYKWCRMNPNYVSDTWYPEEDRIDIIDFGVAKLEKRIAELESRLIMFDDKDEHNVIPINSSLSQLWKKTEKLESVLMNYMEYMKNFNPQSWEKVNQLLKELSGEKDWDFTKGRLDSNSSSIGETSPPDSKPDNPKNYYDYYTCKAEQDVFDALEEDKEALKRIQAEPSTDDDKIAGIVVICPTCRTETIRYFKKGKDLVREFMEKLNSLTIGRILDSFTKEEVLKNIDRLLLEYEARLNDQI